MIGKKKSRYCLKKIHEKNQAKKSISKESVSCNDARVFTVFAVLSSGRWGIGFQWRVLGFDKNNQRAQYMKKSNSKKIKRKNPRKKSNVLFWKKSKKNPIWVQMLFWWISRKNPIWVQNFSGIVVGFFSWFCDWIFMECANSEIPTWYGISGKANLSTAIQIRMLEHRSVARHSNSILEAVRILEICPDYSARKRISVFQKRTTYSHLAPLVSDSSEMKQFPHIPDISNVRNTNEVSPKNCLGASECLVPSPSVQT